MLLQFDTTGEDEAMLRHEQPMLNPKALEAIIEARVGAQLGVGAKWSSPVSQQRAPPPTQRPPPRAHPCPAVTAAVEWLMRDALTDLGRIAASGAPALAAPERAVPGAHPAEQLAAVARLDAALAAKTAKTPRAAGKAVRNSRSSASKRQQGIRPPTVARRRGGGGGSGRPPVTAHDFNHWIAGQPAFVQLARQQQKRAMLQDAT